MATTTLHIPVSALVPASAELPARKGLEAAIALLTVLVMEAEDSVLEQYKQLFTQHLLALPVGSHKALKSKLIRLIAHIDERREEAELAANPERRAGIERVAEHFARKAQSGWSAHPLPERPTNTP